MHAAGGHLVSHALGEAGHGRLGGRVGGMPRFRRPSRVGGDVDHDAAAPRQHAGQDGQRSRDDREDVRLEEAAIGVEAAVGCVDGRRLLDRRVVDEDVDAVVVALDPSQHLGELVDVGHVARDRLARGC